MKRGIAGQKQRHEPRLILRGIGYGRHRPHGGNGVVGQIQVAQQRHAAKISAELVEHRGQPIVGQVGIGQRWGLGGQVKASQLIVRKIQ